MAEYITKDQVIEWFRPYGHTDEGIPFDTLKSDVTGMPCVDAAPVARWIPVTEQLPESFVPVIVCRDGAPGKRIAEQGHKDVGGWWKVYGTRTKRVTHWMPLPEPPKED